MGSESHNKGKRQHYVPACYLANFGVDGNKGRDSVIYFLNKQDLIINCANVETFPAENCFYDVDAFEDYKRVFENVYSVIEGKYANLLKKVIGSVILEPSARETSIVLLSRDDKNALADQLSIQITRTRAYRDRIKEMYQQIKDAFPWADIPDYSDNDFRRIHMAELTGTQSMEFFARMFEDRNWVFLINHTDMPFFTSDNPVVAIDYEPKTNNPKSAAHSKIGYYFPVNPHIAVGIYDKTILPSDMCYMDITDEEDILRFNGELLRQSTRFVFSNVDFRTIQRLTRKPE